MRDESLHPDLSGTLCLVSGCFNHADVLATLTVRVPVEVGVSFLDPPRDVFVLELPLCIDDAHLMRMDTNEVHFDAMRD